MSEAAAVKDLDEQFWINLEGAATRVVDATIELGNLVLAGKQVKGAAVAVMDELILRHARRRATPSNRDFEKYAAGLMALRMDVAMREVSASLSDHLGEVNKKPATLPDEGAVYDSLTQEPNVEMISGEDVFWTEAADVMSALDTFINFRARVPLSPTLKPILIHLEKTLAELARVASEQFNLDQTHFYIELRKRMGVAPRDTVSVVVESPTGSQVGYTVPTDAETGANLKNRFRIPVTHQLYIRWGGKNDDTLVRDSDLIALAPGMVFYSVPSKINCG